MDEGLTAEATNVEVPNVSRHRDLHVDRAPELVSQAVEPVTGIETLPLGNAAGRILKTPIYSPIPVPPFDHSAVDGYAVRSEDACRPQTMLPVTAHLLAGESDCRSVKQTAVRIMTGAPVPCGCDSVVKQEHVFRRGGSVIITDAVHAGANIRRVGEDVAAGDTLVHSGTVLDTRHIALLAACGVGTVQAVRRVRVAIAAFGNELCKPGSSLRPGQIFDANTAMAAAFLDRPCCKVVECVRAGDDRMRAADLIRDLAADADLIVTSGGMAQGDADHTRRALEQAGGFWKEAAFNMKPGKPARLGRIGQSVVLGLPGNPFAALVALLVLGIPIINALAGGSRSLKWLSACAGFELERKPGRTEFFPARLCASGTNGMLTMAHGRVSAG